MIKRIDLLEVAGGQAFGAKPPLHYHSIFGWQLHPFSPWDAFAQFRKF